MSGSECLPVYLVAWHAGWGWLRWMHRGTWYAPMLWLWFGRDFFHPPSASRRLRLRIHAMPRRDPRCGRYYCHMHKHNHMLSRSVLFDHRRVEFAHLRI